MRKDRGNVKEQRVTTGVEVCFAHNAYACDPALYIC